MKELNELVELAKEFDASTTVEAAMAINSQFKSAATRETILAIAEAFRALEQERDSFRSNYSDEYDLRKQVERNWNRLAAASGWIDSRDQNAADNDLPRQFDSAVEMAASWKQRAEAAEAIVADVEEVISLLSEREWAEHCTKTDTGKRLEEAITELHDEAAPAVSLAELLPDEAPGEFVYHGAKGAFDAGKSAGWNACRAEILKNIEERDDEKA